MRSFAVVCIVMLGCSHTTEAPATKEPPARGSAAPMVADAASATKGSADASSEDPATFARYRAGMKRGRKATAARSYSEAIAGFDEALLAKRSDPSALAERGFARLLEGTDLDGALRDFDVAGSGTKDPKLLSMIWFNRGLVEEKRGNTLNATAAFVIANQLRPSAAAKSKLAGKKACPATIDREFDRTMAVLMPDHKLVDAADWVALAQALPHRDDVPTTTQGVLQAFMNSDGEPTLPGTIEVIDGLFRNSYVVWRHGAGLRAVPVGYAQLGRCPGSVAFDVSATDATRIHVAGKEKMEDGWEPICESNAGDRHPCDDPDDLDGARVQSACKGGSTTIRDAVIDIASGRVVLVVEQPAAEHPVAVTLTPAGLKLTGLECDRVEPFSK